MMGVDNVIEVHRIHHVGNVNDYCCGCGCCHTVACEDWDMDCYALWGEGECLDGMTTWRIESENEATAKRLLDY